MLNRIILIIYSLAILPCIGCVSGPLDYHREEIVFEQGRLQKYSYLADNYGKKDDSSPFLEAIDIIKHADPTAFPELQDLPLPASQKRKAIKQYTGIIKNRTKYDVDVPSGNSGSTLTIPARGWIEYIAWIPAFELTSYVDGKPFYCHKIKVNPKSYPFMCKNYDFMAVIDKPEPTPTKPKPKKKKVKRKKKDC